MAAKQIVDSLLARIAAPAPAGATVYAILDAARDARIPALVADSGLEHACLFGNAPEALRSVAPYLVALKPDAPFVGRVLELGWGEAWGTLVRSRAALPALRRHLRTILRVAGAGLRILYFRYYDPRVLRVYLPTCTSQELAQVFGPIDGFDIEGERAGELLRMNLEAGLDGRLSLAVSTLALGAGAEGQGEGEGETAAEAPARPRAAGDAPLDAATPS